MTHLDLFSGIGGFALAARWAGLKTIGFSEIEPFCCELLKKRFEGIKNYGDIRKINGHKISADIITGGFPCQPFSCAGKQRGKEDDRYLWPEMLRVISEVKPTWIVGENVAGIESIFEYKDFSELESEKYHTREDAISSLRGITGRKGTSVLYMVLEDLAKLGYEIQPLIIPACALNAHHRRDRVWIVAHARCKYEQGQEKPGEYRKQNIPENALEFERPAEGHGAGIDTDSDNQWKLQPQRTFGNIGGWIGNGIEDDTNSLLKRPQRGFIQDSSKGAQSGDKQFAGLCELWNQSWLEVATELCRVDDGLSVELDEFKLSKSKHRECRLKGLGNAIVPEIAYIILKKIKEIEDASQN